MARVPAQVPVATVSPVFTVMYYVFLAALTYLLLRRVHWAPVGQWHGRMAEVSLALVCGASTLSISMVHASGDMQDRLEWLGTGESILLQSRGMTALIDGSPQPFVLLERLGEALPANMHSIDLMIVTDPRAGNISGLQEVLRHYRIEEVLDVGAEYPSVTYARWRADLRSRRIPAYALRTGAATKVGAATITALGPDNLYPNTHDCIGLLRITMNSRSYLLAGAASRREQLEAIFRPIHLRSNVLVIVGKSGYESRFVLEVRPSSSYAPFEIPHGSSFRRLTTKTAVLVDR
jgi:beta-lactamase superfamily II metal-dependent hydrolase